jgi:hypothetical protein
MGIVLAVDDEMPRGGEGASLSTTHVHNLPESAVDGHIHHDDAVAVAVAAAAVVVVVVVRLGTPVHLHMAH